MSNPPSSQGLIPDDLLSNIKKGECVLFLGADLPLSYLGAPPSRPELAAALAERYDLPTGLSWPDTVQAYLGKHPNDHHGVRSFVLQRCAGPQVQPGPLHQAIARAGFRAIVTGWYDDLLEEALKQAGYRVNRLVRDTQLPYAEEGERAAIVIKLYGCLSDPDSLVLDRWEHERLMDQLSRKLEVVTAFCTLRPPLFVNFDLLQSTPIRLYVRASANLADHMRRAYAVWPGELDAVQATWQGQNVAFRQGDAAAFLGALAGQTPAVGAGPALSIRVHRPPYKFLDYYEAKDADIFCGRDTESQIVARLAAEGYGHVYVRALDDPLPAVCKEVATRAGRTFDPADDINLRAFLEQTLAPNDKLVVVLDQLVPMLADLYPQVRTAAIASLERLRPDGAWRSHLTYECYVPAGEFIMGEDSGYSEEKPAHRIILDAYYIGRYPVTNAEYARYRGDIRQPFEMPAGKQDHPVVEVNRYDVRDYAAWANMRLLTEAEWEKAASWEVDKGVSRQGDKWRKRKYPWGNRFNKKKCNSTESGIGGTTPVGAYSPGGDSPCGAADMAGNVWEWVADWYDSGYYARSSPDNPQARKVATGVWCVAAPSSTVIGMCAAPSGSTTILVPVTAMSVFVLCVSPPS